MSNQLLAQTQELCRLYDIHPSRSKGQNFLVDESAYDKIIAAAELNPDDLVLEVGPGLGFLTAKLAKRCRRVVAVELDDKLAELLKLALDSQNVENVEIINRDILSLKSLNEIFGPDWHSGLSFKIVANLPYNITSIFLRKFLSNSDWHPGMVVLMLQKEVVERIVAKPPHMSLLAISVQYYASAEMAALVSSSSFWPAPKVDSAVIKIIANNGENKQKSVDDEAFFRLLKFGFSAKRKMLKNNLAGGLHMSTADAEKEIVAAGLNPKARPQELSVSEWLILFAKLRNFVV